MTTPAELIDQAAPATRQVPVCLDTDAQLAWQAARKRLSAVKAAKGDVEQARERVQAAAEAAAAHTVVVTVRALSAPEVQQVLDEHPPRIVGDKFNRFDLAEGYNRATYPAALIRMAMDGPDITPAQWVKFQHAMTHGQFDMLFKTVTLLSERITPPDLPFESAASEQTRD